MEDERLEKVGEKIEQARREAEDAGILDDPDEPKYYESGDLGKDQDDQEIAPPG